MLIEIWTIGKQNEKEVQILIDEYEKRIKKYLRINWVTFKNFYSEDSLLVIKKESELILSKLTPAIFLILLDRQTGKTITSENFAVMLQQQLEKASTKIVFLIGGAFGVDESVIKRANVVLNISSFTLPHRLVRLFLVEQIYRAYTIIHRISYHH